MLTRKEKLVRRVIMKTKTNTGKGTIEQTAARLRWEELEHKRAAEKLADGGVQALVPGVEAVVSALVSVPAGVPARVQVSFALGPEAARRVEAWCNQIGGGGCLTPSGLIRGAAQYGIGAFLASLGVDSDELDAMLRMTGPKIDLRK